MITPTSIKAQFPEFSSIDDSVIQNYIDQAQFLVDPNVFCGEINGILFSDVAQSYFVASNLYTQVVKGLDMANAAPISNKSAGQTSIGLAVQAIDAGDPDALLMSNKYGQQYLMFRNSLGGVITTSANALITPNIAACC